MSLLGFSVVEQAELLRAPEITGSAEMHQVAAQDVAHVGGELHDQRTVEQFASYVGDVLRGDLGVSVSTNRPVASDLARVFPATLEMATIGIVIGVALGVPMGVIAVIFESRPNVTFDVFALCQHVEHGARIQRDDAKV